MYWQRTLRNEIHCRSVGLHTGRKVGMTISPADVDEGITFIRRDLPGKPRIKAEVANVCDTTLATTIGLNGASVSTVEHLLSAFSGMGVDNATVEVDAHEVPIMDGSAQPFVNMLKEVGTRTQGKGKKLMVINSPVSVADANGSAAFLPCREFKITYTIDFPHPVIGRQTCHVHLSDETYEREICAARTFGFLKDVEYLQAIGLALGGSLKNAIVLDDRRIINKGGLRVPDEFVRHKVLDAIGDLSMLGMPIIGHFVAFRSGHRLNNLLLKELLARRECWEIVSRYPQESSSRIGKSLHIPSFGILDAVSPYRAAVYQSR
ncbi:MAG: UDP-3-O-acyl-N-acetylglucosamine deacetylase [Syntrophobacterales bacterium]|nr:UDP-3-O-acyl-N-acetylglucosamine deacetylase [Syntrophobacterales bacterium]